MLFPVSAFAGRTNGANSECPDSRFRGNDIKNVRGDRRRARRKSERGGRAPRAARRRRRRLRCARSKTGGLAKPEGRPARSQRQSAPAPEGAKGNKARPLALALGSRGFPEPARRPAAPERSEGTKGLRSPRSKTNGKAKRSRKGLWSREENRPKAGFGASKKNRSRNRKRKWYLAESNCGHQDFQSCALPTELRYPVFASANLQRFFHLSSPYLVCLQT